MGFRGVVTQILQIDSSLPPDSLRDLMMNVLAGIGTIVLSILLGVRTTRQGIASSLVPGLWALFSIFSVTTQWILVFWSFIRITTTFTVFSIIKLCVYANDYIGWLTSHPVSLMTSELRQAKTHAEWMTKARAVDTAQGLDAWRKNDSHPNYQWHLVRQQLDTLVSRRTQEGSNASVVAYDEMYQVRGVLSRHYAHMTSPSLYTEALSGTKELIHDFTKEIVSSLDNLCSTESPIPASTRLDVLSAAYRTLGKTALCLSGGGTLSMYHLGVIKALIAEDLLPKVISGSSGGAIVAGILAIYTDEELPGILVPSVASSRGVEFFQPLSAQLYHFMRHGVVMPASFFSTTLEAYFGDTTFSEAYARTRRAVSIGVTMSGSRHNPKATVLLMNHISAPHVLIRTAIHASCALPGLLDPVELLAKDSSGVIVPYMPAESNIRFVDGSLKADIPMKRLSELFNVTQCIVSQVNPHVVPFAANKQVRQRGTLSRLQYYLMLDLKHSLGRLATLSLIPKVFGFDMGDLVTQKYRGDITIYPKLSLVDNFKAISHPTSEDMERYIREGMRSAFPHIVRIEQACRIEKQLIKSIRILRTMVKDEGDIQLDTKDELMCPGCVKNLTLKGYKIVKEHHWNEAEHEVQRLR